MNNAKQLLKQLIKEEMSNQWVFTTPLNNKHIEVFVNKTGYELHDIEATASIKWEADIETRSWGIKNIYPNILSVTVSYTVYDPDTGNSVYENQINWAINNTQGWAVEAGTKTDGEMMFPTNITVDESKKFITVDF